MLENPKFKARNIFKNIEEKVNEITKTIETLKPYNTKDDN